MTNGKRLVAWGLGFAVIVLVLLVRHSGLYVWIAVLGVAVGYFLVAEAAWFRALRPWLPARDIGTALVISGLFALTYEGYLRKQAIEEVVKEIAPYYITYPLPEEVASEVKYLASLQMLRKDVEYHLKLTRPGPSVDSIWEEATVSYTMVNYSTDSLPFQHVAGVRGGPRRAGEILDAAASGPDLLGAEYDTTLHRPDFARKVKIPPNSKQPRNKFELRARFPRHADDSETFFSRDPTMNVTVIVEAPEDLHVEVYFGHRNVKGTPISRTRWRLQGVQLPWSAVYVEWYRVTPSVMSHLPHAVQEPTRP